MLSLLLFAIFAGTGILGIFFSIEFWEYLRTYRPKQWEAVTYERAFGIPREEFPINPIRPLKFFAAVFSSEDGGDVNIPAYKMKLKLIFIAFVLLFLALVFMP